MRFFVFGVVFFLCDITLSAQTTIVGRVVNVKGQPVEFTNVVLLDVHDSTFLSGAVTEANGSFSLSTKTSFPYLLRVSCVGHRTHCGSYHTPDIGDVILLEEKTGLEEVSVVGKQAVMQKRDGILTMNIENSYLKDESSVSRILAKVPGVLVSKDEITMFGKEHLDIYIDDRKMISQSQMQSILPTEIERIEIISTPGAEYSGSTDAVIKIRLKKQKKDQTRITLNETVSANSRSFDNNARFNLQINTSKWSNRLFYSNNFSDSHSIQRDKSEEFNYLKDYTNLNRRNVLRGGNYNQHYAFYAVQYDFNDKNEIGFQYSGFFPTGKNFNDGVQTIYQNDQELERREFHNVDESKTRLHNFSLNYTAKMKRDAVFTVITDYAVADIDQKNHIDETVVATGRANKFVNYSSGDYHIFSVNPQFRIPGKSVSVTTGAHYSTMKDKSQVEYPNKSKENLYDLKEHTAALYANLNIKTKPVNFSVGLRGEYMIQSVLNSDAPQAKLEREYWDLFPYLTVSKDFTDNINASVSYRRYVERISFTMLNPTYFYKDTLSYRSGNPYIKPTMVDIIGLNLNVWKFSLDAGYYFYQNSTYLAKFQDKDNPSIIQSTYGNLQYNNRLFYCGISYSYDHRIISLMGSLRIDAPYTKVSFKDSFITLTKPIWMGQFSANVNVTPNTSLFGSFVYSSRGDYDIMQFHSSHSVDLGAKQYLLKKQFLISVGVYDLFQTNKTNRFSSNADYVRYAIDSDPYSRLFEVSVRYIFGKTKKEIQQQSSSSDARNRM